MDKLDIVKCLRVANNLWAIEGANPYSVKAHERAADAILHSHLTIPEILNMPPGSIYGVGRETLAMIRTLEVGGMEALLQRLQITIPVEASQLVRLPGIGPKTAHNLIHQHGILSVDDLAASLNEGKLQNIPGLGSSRMARLQRELRVFLERKHAVPIAMAWPFANQFQDAISRIPGVTQVAITGDIRRLSVMSSAVEFAIASRDHLQVAKWARQFSGSTSSSHPAAEPQTTIDITVKTERDDILVRMHLTDEASFPALLMRTTGDETHQTVISDLLKQSGIEWTSADLLQESGDTLPIENESEIYSLVGLPFWPPEIREGRGMLCDVAELVKQSDICGDLHVHTTWSDGSLSIRKVVRIAEELGYEYIAITDHSQSLAIAGGLTPEQLRQQKGEIQEVQQETKIKILRGIEVDILTDGKLDLPNDVLSELDIVIASVHSSMQQSKADMTERILSAIHHPAVNVIGHLTGRILGRRSAYEIDVDRLLGEAMAQGVMFELNANPNRLDISEDLLRKAKSMGMLIPINTDAHHQAEFQHMAYGIRMAKRGWLYRADVLNTLPYDKLMQRCGKGVNLAFWFCCSSRRSSVLSTAVLESKGPISILEWFEGTYNVLGRNTNRNHVDLKNPDVQANLDGTSGSCLQTEPWEQCRTFVAALRAS